MESAASYKSLLFQMTQTTPTCLWNDSAALDELTYSIEHGAVGATCNPVIALSILKRQMALALALGLPPEVPQREKIVTISFAVVAFSVFAQGLTMAPFLRRVGEIPRSGWRQGNSYRKKPRERQ